MNFAPDVRLSEIHEINSLCIRHRGEQIHRTHTTQTSSAS